MTHDITSKLPEKWEWELPSADLGERMQKFSVATLDELKRLLNAFGDDVLYRGQVQQYDSDGAPRMSTSFSRNGCLPPLMLKWSHYAGFSLAALLGQHYREVASEFTQAVLQHYGWRSFYLDASVDPAVSAWFASHVFSSSRSIELCEDCFEDPVFLIKLQARYTHEEGAGFLYVLSKEALSQNGLGLFDLSSIELPNCRPRFHAQHAWLIGPLYNDLPADCIIASIEAPRSLLRSYANERGFVETDHLFPDTEDDPVLALLASMPWRRRHLPNEKKDSLKFFDQPIELPEFHDSFRKHNPSYIAFYEGESSRSHRIAPDVMVFDVPEEVVYGSANPIATKFPRIVEIVRGAGSHLIFEIDDLVRRPGRLTSEYLKGLAVSKCNNDLFVVADFIVDHPGRQMSGCGINMGWHYRISSDETWVREITSDDCPCENNSVHEHHLSMLTIIERQLEEGSSSIILRKSPASPDVVR